MGKPAALADTLEVWAEPGGVRNDIAQTLIAVAEAGREIAELLALASHAAEQQDISRRAHALLLDALSRAPLAAVASSEDPSMAVTGKSTPLCAAVDPLRGASDIDTDAALGTVFSLLPAIFEGDRPSASCFLQPGSRQLAAGYVLYGLRTVLAATVGEGTAVYSLDRRAGRFGLATSRLEMPVGASILSVDALGGHRWEDPVRSYVDDWLAEHEGLPEASFRIHRSPSPAAGVHRLLHRGGVLLFPADTSGRGAAGRLGLVFEANPLAWLTEQAGGAASTGTERILDVVPAAVDQRTPCVFGARDQVERVERYHADHRIGAARSPLFVRRGLFLA